MKAVFIVGVLCAGVLAGGGCKTLELLGVQGEPDAIVAIAEAAILQAAEAKGVVLSKDQLHAFTELIKERPEIDAAVAEVVAQNAEHEAIKKLADDLAGKYLGL